MKRTKLWGWFWTALGILYFFLPLYATLDFSLRAKSGELTLLASQRVLAKPAHSTSTQGRSRSKV